MKQFTWLIPVFAILQIILAFVLKGQGLQWLVVALSALILLLSYGRLLAFFKKGKKTEPTGTQ